MLTACVKSESDGQQNPLGQVMWVSNSLEGYRIPSSAEHSLSALSKTLMGPAESGPVKLGGIVMERPHHGALDPRSHPRTATDAARSGAYGHLQYNPDVLDVAVCGCSHMVFSLRVSDSANKGSMQMKTFPAILLVCKSVCLSVSGVWDISIIEGKFTQIPQPCQPMTGSPGGQLGFSSKGH